jgi:NTP pyrophosphatase (non-canonical NTP hydrolase)
MPIDEFMRTVELMRLAQKAYFKTKSREDLISAKQFEKIVDEQVAKQIGDRTALLGQEQNMSLNEYQAIALNFRANDLNSDICIAVWALGITGEAGEVADLIKKHLGHGHELDVDKVAKEVGDVLWYLAALGDQLGFSLGAIAEMNINKLRDRYPDGFSRERSINRHTD